MYDCQSICHCTDQSINRLTDRSINQSNNRPLYLSTISIHQQTHKWIHDFIDIQMYIRVRAFIHTYTYTLSLCVVITIHDVAIINDTGKSLFGI